MEVSKDWCTAALIVTAVVVLAVNYGYLAADSLSVSAGALSISGVKAINKLLLPIVELSILLGCCFCHIRHQWGRISERFSAGYRESKSIVELVRMKVAEAAKSDRYGSPYGGIRASLWKRSHGIGRFQTPDETLSEIVLITPDNRTHNLAVLGGIRRALSRNLWLPVYAPLLLAIWALLSIAV